jgi:ABC-type protease/lipase transport system fused ATPase/permease subunit
MALSQAVAGVRARGGIVIVIAHRPSAIANVDQLLVLTDGRVQGVGPKDDILKKLLRPAPTPPAPPAAAVSPARRAG